MHRYQLEATAKLLGGLDYTYKVKGDNQRKQTRLDGAQQREALTAVMYALNPVQLALPNHIISMMPPRPLGYARNRETFPSRNGLNFDPMAPAENVVDMTFQFLLEAGRGNRLHQQKLFDTNLPSFAEVLDKVFQDIFDSKFEENYKGEIKLMTENKLVDKLIDLSRDPQSTTTVRAIVRRKLKDMVDATQNPRFSFLLGRTNTQSNTLNNHSQYLADKIISYLNLPEQLNSPKSVEIPDGPPIGSEEMACDFDH
jgi:hypothetical protein